MTPSSLLSLRSMRVAHDAQVMPLIVSSTSVTGISAAVYLLVAVLMVGDSFPRSAAVARCSGLVDVPGRGHSRGSGRGAGGQGELRGAHGGVVLEIQEQPVGPGARHLGDELDLRAGPRRAVLR